MVPLIRIMRLRVYKCNGAKMADLPHQHRQVCLKVRIGSVSMPVMNNPKGNLRVSRHCPSYVMISTLL
eukprot:6277469-Pyramimonas_sp.AAC.1